MCEWEPFVPPQPTCPSTCLQRTRRNPLERASYWNTTPISDTSGARRERMNVIVNVNIAKNVVFVKFGQKLRRTGGLTGVGPIGLSRVQPSRSVARACERASEGGWPRGREGGRMDREGVRALRGDPPAWVAPPAGGDFALRNLSRQRVCQTKKFSPQNQDPRKYVRFRKYTLVGLAVWRSGSFAASARIDFARVMPPKLKRNPPFQWRNVEEGDRVEVYVRSVNWRDAERSLKDQGEFVRGRPYAPFARAGWYAGIVSDLRTKDRCPCSTAPKS